jgi:regulatory protein
MPAPKPSLKARALRYLAMREHSRLELERKLVRYAVAGEDVGALLDSLEAAKLLSQERFAEALVHRRALRFGNNRILSELQSHGMSAETLRGLKPGLASEENVRARQVLQRKFGAPPSDAAEKARQIRFLQQRGFSHEAIRAALRWEEESA